MYKTVNRIEVYIWGHKVGAVALDPKSGYYVFAYYPQFSKLGIELAPIQMPVAASSPFVFAFLPELTFKRLPALLADCLPDDFGNGLIDAWMAKQGVSKRDITTLDRLAYMGKRGMGALEFKPDRTHPKHSTTAIKLSNLVEAARKAIHGDLNNGDLAEASLNQLIRVGTSAGGARAKATIAWDPATDEIRAGQFETDPGFEHWLLKFDGLGLDFALGSSMDYGRIEYAYYLMATNAGIKMSPCRLMLEGNRAHFMTKRFDRDENQKIHMQTLCAMAHLDFKQIATHDYSQLFQTIDQLGLDYDAKEESFRRMVFNVLSVNCDDHTKNISFLLKERGAWELAPAYDVTHSFNPEGEWTHQHLMSVNGKFKKITRADIMSVADRFAIGTAGKVIKQVEEAIEGWSELADKAGIDPSEIVRIKNDHEKMKFR
ncbi:MAG: type II toxin-antitoxin system HipA family toxin [Desulfobacteraceae bacterium]|nr:type II toxin-antitoxin system HipA family toxin [Desulfobacteraceae bacterium]